MGNVNDDTIPQMIRRIQVMLFLFLIGIRSATCCCLTAPPYGTLLT